MFVFVFFVDEKILAQVCQDVSLHRHLSLVRHATGHQHDDAEHERGCREKLLRLHFWIDHHKRELRHELDLVLSQGEIGLVPVEPVAWCARSWSRPYRKGRLRTGVHRGIMAGHWAGKNRQSRYAGGSEY